MRSESTEANLMSVPGAWEQYKWNKDSKQRLKIMSERSEMSEMIEMSARSEMSEIYDSLHHPPHGTALLAPRSGSRTRSSSRGLN